MHESLENIESSFITYGYFGESYTYDILNRSKLFTIDDFLDYYIGTRVPNLSHDYEAFRKHISEKCLRVIGAKSGSIFSRPVD